MFQHDILLHNAPLEPDRSLLFTALGISDLPSSAAHGHRATDFVPGALVWALYAHPPEKKTVARLSTSTLTERTRHPTLVRLAARKTKQASYRIELQLCVDSSAPDCLRLERVPEIAAIDKQLGDCDNCCKQVP